MTSSQFESDFDEVEEFDEYNPHPYQGGYDIALTYGRPLPPSSAICYPISPSPSSAAGSETSSVPASPQGELERRRPLEGGEPAWGSDSAGEELGHGYGIDGFRGSEDGYLPGEAGYYPEVFGYWPFPAQGFEESHGRRDTGEWDILNCAANYLFEYLHAYGEKRNESYSYGNLNYAYERHRLQEPLLIQCSPREPSWCGPPSYHEDGGEEVCTHSEYVVSYGGNSSEAAHSEVVGVGTSWSSAFYHEDYSRQVYPQSDYSYAYEGQHYEQPLSVPHEQVEHTWSEKPSFSELYESHVPPQPVDMHNYGSKLYEQPLDLIDFIEKSWNQMLKNPDSGEGIKSTSRHPLPTSPLSPKAPCFGPTTNNSPLMSRAECSLTALALNICMDDVFAWVDNAYFVCFGLILFWPAPWPFVFQGYAPVILFRSFLCL